MVAKYLPDPKSLKKTSGFLQRPKLKLNGLKILNILRYAKAFLQFRNILKRPKYH